MTDYQRIGMTLPRYKAQWSYKEPKDLVPKPDLSKQIKPQWYPRELLDVSLPRVKLYILFISDPFVRSHLL